MPEDFRVSARQEDGAAVVAIEGRVATANAQRLLEAIRNAVPDAIRRMTLDLAQVHYFDSGGAALLLRLRQELAARKVELHIEGSTSDIDGMMSLMDAETILQPLKGHGESLPIVERVGEAAMHTVEGSRTFASFVGELFLGLGDAIQKPGQVRWRDTWLYMQRTGYEGLPIVALISFLMGLITAFQAAIQLTQFGAEIYVANLVGLSITRELGPLMTAIIAAGRSGAAFAAEIGTMKVSEEVDALEAMGLDRTRFLVTPKVIALVLMLPCLTLFADLVGILGGLIVAVFSLNLPSVVYFRQMKLYMSIGDVNTGLIKSVVFALLIAAIGCLRGFQATSGAESVGRITTSAIVTSIFAIIVADAIFTVLFHYW